MKSRLSFLMFLFTVFIGLHSFAQERTVKGTVTDESGMPVPGVSVLVKGTSTGVETDFDGKYSIKALTNQTLVFSMIGMTKQELPANSTTINVKMKEDAQELEGVVVTAQGIKKEKKSLGYAVSEVKAKDIEQRPDGDIGRVLTGKAAGVQITAQNGMSGSGTNIVIRGLSSFSGSNQALFIVDGVPFSTETNSMGRGGDRNDFVNGNNGSSRFLDLDPNNIESVNVLKGLAAATLYGSQGRNGVILITTKSGSSKKGAKKTEVTVSSSLFLNEIASLPDYQNKFGIGFDQAFGWFFSNWGPSFDRTGPASWTNSSAFDANGTVAHPYSTANFAAAFPEFAGKRYKYQPYNGVKDFFKTGIITNNAIGLKGSSDDGKFSFSANYSHTDDEGFTPENFVVRNTISLGGKAQLSNKFTISGTFNYANTNFVSPPVALSQGNGITGTGSSVFGDLWFTPRSIDLMNLPFENPNTGASVYYRQNNSIQHPLWTLKNASTQQKTSRFFGNATVSYEINKNLNVFYRVGLDTYNEYNTNYQNRGGVNTNVRTVSGILETWNNEKTLWDHSVILTGNYELSSKFNLNFNAGATSRNEKFNQNGISSDGQVIFNVLRHYNFSNYLPIESFAERNIVGVFSQLELDYNKYIYLTLAGRKDWVSDFAVENRSILYPSASISFLPTAAFSGLNNNKYLNFLKLRAGIGSSANFGDFGAYPISNVIFQNVRDSQTDGGQNIITNELGSILGNPNLKPELLTEFEFGIESKMFQNRLDLNLSVYQRNTKDLIIDRPLDPSTGFTRTKTNIGKIEGKGVEIDFDAHIIKNEDKGFNWNLNGNFNTQKVKVVDLGLDTERVVYSGFSNLGNVAQVGESLYSIFGSKVLRDTNGNLVIDGNGNYLQDPNDGIIGDANPDFILNIGNTFKYHNFSLNFLVNYTHGGDIYSSTISTLLGRGLITETLDRENTFILPGVLQNGQPNNIQINNSDYYFTNVLFGPSELQVYDASTIRLQEVSLAYSLSQKNLDKTPFSNITFTLSGNNLYFRAINTPKGANFDPNTSGTGVGNGNGFDFLNGPSSRRFGFSVKATF